MVLLHTYWTISFNTALDPDIEDYIKEKAANFVRLMVSMAACQLRLYSDKRESFAFSMRLLRILINRLCSEIKV